MPEGDEPKLGSLVVHLERVYADVAALCLRLPVAVKLPTGNPLSQETRVAVGRVAETAPKMPLPIDGIHELQIACLGWLTAAEMKHLITNEKELTEHRFACAALGLITAEGALVDLRIVLDDLRHWD
ncbi:hypothetical protein [Streptomyces sp. MAR4 CNX-425]|uniref:hypothetical protein n=1 Tax=Streptomyces sp. MAR4 CNX-425 TaxID=3406343 RepID=UPI003B50A955